jgi:hypothetical protein
MGPEVPTADVWRELLVRMCRLVHDEFEDGIESDPEDVVVSVDRVQLPSQAHLSPQIIKNEHRV